mgnify:FL=1
MIRIFFLILICLISCNKKQISKKEHSIYWQKYSAEYVALSHQAFNIAKDKLDKNLEKNYSKKPAIIIDIDETILNNLPYNEMLIDSSKNFDHDSWSKWVNKKIATAIPGSLDFLNYANSRNIELIYLSNRKVENYNPTKENLISLGFPFNNGTLMLLMDETTDKTKRRNSLSEYEIIMLLGDNLSDFNSVFHKKTNKERIKNVDSLSHLFGEKFIVLPNLIYGAWEQGFE